MMELAEEIEKNPDQIVELLTSFPTNNRDERSFLFSMQEIPSYVVPKLIRVFATEYKKETPKTLAQLIGNNWPLGSVFTLQDHDKYNYGFEYVGVTASGKVVCRADSSNMTFDMDLDTEIYNVF